MNYQEALYTCTCTDNSTTPFSLFLADLSFPPYSFRREEEGRTREEREGGREKRGREGGREKRGREGGREGEREGEREGGREERGREEERREGEREEERREGEREGGRGKRGREGGVRRKGGGETELGKAVLQEDGWGSDTDSTDHSYLYSQPPIAYVSASYP